jgi:hypothetical protein
MKAEYNKCNQYWLDNIEEYCYQTGRLIAQKENQYKFPILNFTGG